MGLSPCASRYLRIAVESGAPLTLEVIKSVAALCGENPYSLWVAVSSSSAPRAVTTAPASAEAGEGVENKRERWTCSACFREFEDVRHLVNHITYFVRQGDKAHLELYQKLKKLSAEKGRTFTEVAAEALKAPG